ncbi:MAG: tetratricopeptide repeat protein [candidate division Zixibacteria bacterium]|nr:tetratricopeptide repeat protein [candidate division Zixibacteria bacterium]
MRKPLFLTVTGGFLIVALCLAGAVWADTEEGKVPITTSSQGALGLFLEGRGLVENLRIQEGRQLFVKAVAADPDFALAHLNVAIYAETFVDYFKSIEKAKKLADRVSKGEQLLIRRVEAAVNGNQPELRRVLRELIELYPDDERAQFMLANDLAVQQDYETALEHYRRAIEINEQFQPVYNSMGYMLRTMERYDEADEAFRKYIALIPNDPNPHDSYAELLLKMGRYDESILHYQKALTFDPNFAASRFGIATNQCMKGDYEAAYQQIDTALATARDDLERRAAWAARAVIAVDEGKMENALDYLWKLYQIAESASDTLTMSADLRTTGRLQLETDDFENAARQFKTARDLVLASGVDPAIKEQARGNYMFDMTCVYCRRGDAESARVNAEGYAKYAEKQQDANLLRTAHQLRGMVALHAGNFEKAATELQQANLQNPYNLYRLARAYKGMGAKDRAEPYCKSAANFNAVNDINYSLARQKARQMIAEM